MVEKLNYQLETLIMTKKKKTTSLKLTPSKKQKSKKIDLKETDEQYLNRIKAEHLDWFITNGWSVSKEKEGIFYGTSPDKKIAMHLDVSKIYTKKELLSEC